MYISTKERWKIIKKKIGKNNGNPVYKEILEYTCEECNKEFESELSFNESGYPNVKCPFCSNN